MTDWTMHSATPCTGPQMREFDWLVPRDQLSHYLQALATRFEEGLDAFDIHAIYALAEQMQLGDEEEQELPIRYDGKPMDLKLGLALVEPTFWLVHICTAPEIADELDSVSEEFYDALAA